MEPCLRTLRVTGPRSELKSHAPQPHSDYLERLAVKTASCDSAHGSGLDPCCFSNAPRVRNSLQALSAQVMSLWDAQRHPLDFAQQGERLRGFIGKRGNDWTKRHATWIR